MIATTGLLDRDTGITHFLLTVKAADDGSPVNTVTGTMTVTLTAVNEHTPAFTKSIYYTSVGEGDAADTRYFIAHLHVFPAPNYTVYSRSLIWDQR